MALAAAELKKNGSFKLGGMLNMYMLDQRCDNQYKMSNVKNHEFTFTVDDKEIGCGLNGAWRTIRHTHWLSLVHA